MTATLTETLKVQIDGLLDKIDFQADYFAPLSSSNKTLLICLPGGGSSKEFFDLGTFEGVDYSFTSRMQAKGYGLLTLDHPGTASNPLPNDHPFLTPHQSATYVNLALAQTLKQIPEFEHLIGVGHSMGGMMVTLLQAAHTPFKALALLGSSAGGLEWGLDDHEKTYIDRADAFEADLKTLTLRKFKSEFPAGMGGPTGKSITFGGENEAVTQRLRDVSCELYAAGGMMSMTRGSFRKEVETIDTDILFGFGDHDIGIPPEDAPKDYINASSTELLVLRNTGHNSLAFSSIQTLCERLDNWIKTNRA